MKEGKKHYLCSCWSRRYARCDGPKEDQGGIAFLV